MADTEFKLIPASEWERHTKTIDEIKEEVKKRNHEEWANKWVDNEKLLERLGISPKTAQKYRDQGLIAYTQVGSKIWYQNKDIEDFLLRYRIKRKGGER